MGEKKDDILGRFSGDLFRPPTESEIATVTTEEVAELMSEDPNFFNHPERKEDEIYLENLMTDEEDMFDAEKFTSLIYRSKRLGEKAFTSTREPLARARPIFVNNKEYIALKKRVNRELHNFKTWGMHDIAVENKRRTPKEPGKVN